VRAQKKKVVVAAAALARVKGEAGARALRPLYLYLQVYK